MSDLTLRASDADRDAVVDRLHVAFAEGRLTGAELEERLQQALTARAVAELAALTADLPATETGRAAAPHRPRLDLLRAAWGAWALAVTINLVIWALVTLGARELVYFWPMWVAGPWGAVLLVRTLAPSSAVPSGACAARPRSR